VDIRKLPKKNNETETKKSEEIEALEYMKDTLSLWDKLDTINMEEHNDAQ
jgi:hypothetical protein